MKDEANRNVGCGLSPKQPMVSAAEAQPEQKNLTQRISAEGKTNPEILEQEVAADASPCAFGEPGSENHST